MKFFKEEDEKLAPFAVLFRKKEFFSFRDIRRILNELLKIKIDKVFFTESDDVYRFNASFDITKSIWSSYINSNPDPVGFDILSTFFQSYLLNSFLYILKTKEKTLKLKTILNICLFGHYCLIGLRSRRFSYQKSRYI